MLPHNDNSEQNGSAIILMPDSLTATKAAETTTTTTTTTATLIPPTTSGDAEVGTRLAAGHEEYKGPEIWLYLVHHWPLISQQLAILAIFLLTWLVGYTLLPEQAVPSTAVMRIALLFIGADLCGIVATLMHLPDMLGMLFFGVLYANMGWADFTGYQKFEAFMRQMALTNIMLLAGFGLDGKAFRRLWCMILRLSLVPTMAEVTVIAVLAHYLLAMPWLWGVLLGLVVTAVSPNVVVTVMLKLKDKRLGLNDGIHTLIYAMTTSNDVVSIFAFGIVIGMIFSTGTLLDQALQGPIGFGIGIVFGFVYGLLLQYLPSKHSHYVYGLRFVLTVLGGAIAVFGSKAIAYPSAGALGCVTVAFTAGIGWRQQQKRSSHHQYANENDTVLRRLDLLWKFLKPVSFALIGKEINLAILDGKVVGYGVLLVLFGSLFRLGFAYISTYGGDLSSKERAYITISGFPKATVQAALGPIAMDVVRALHAPEENLVLANNILIVSVLAIIFTAPLGAILMVRLAPHWLRYCPVEEHSSVHGFVADSVDKFVRNQHPYNSTKSQNALEVAASGATGALPPTTTAATAAAAEAAAEAAAGEAATAIVVVSEINHQKAA